MRKSIMALLLVGAFLMPAAYAADDKIVKKPGVPAIEVELTAAGDTVIPAEFRYAIFEHLVTRLKAAGTFQNVYRSGDSRAKKPEVVVLKTSIAKFKQGNQTARELTHVMGYTAVDVDVTLAGKDGKSVFDGKVTGHVRFQGDNMKVTDDIAKRVTKLLGESFVATGTATAK